MLQGIHEISLILGIEASRTLEEEPFTGVIILAISHYDHYLNHSFFHSKHQLVLSRVRKSSRR